HTPSARPVWTGLAGDSRGRGPDAGRVRCRTARASTRPCPRPTGRTAARPRPPEPAAISVRRTGPHAPGQDLVANTPPARSAGAGTVPAPALRAGVRGRRWRFGLVGCQEGLPCYRPSNVVIRILGRGALGLPQLVLEPRPAQVASPEQAQAEVAG